VGGEQNPVMLPLIKGGERRMHLVSGVFDSPTLLPFPFCLLPWLAMSAMVRRIVDCDGGL